MIKTLWPRATPSVVPESRFVKMILIVGVGLAGLYTASVASLLVKRYLRRSDVSNYQIDGHLVLCNWSSPTISSFC